MTNNFNWVQGGLSIMAIMRTLAILKNTPNKKSCLKPCPICGSEPKLHENTHGHWGDDSGNIINIIEYWYECAGCRIIKGGRFVTYSDNVADAKKEALENWNEVVDYLKTKIKDED